MNIKDISLKYLQPLAKEIKRFRFILFLGLFAVMYAYLLITIGQLTTATPTQADVDTEMQASVKRLRVDEEAVESMLRLEEENIEVRGLFEDARNNPFAE